MPFALRNRTGNAPSLPALFRLAPALFRPARARPGRVAGFGRSSPMTERDRLAERAAPAGPAGPVQPSAPAARSRSDEISSGALGLALASSISTIWERSR